jgi:hypothetical protein
METKMNLDTTEVQNNENLYLRPIRQRWSKGKFWQKGIPTMSEQVIFEH